MGDKETLAKDGAVPGEVFMTDYNRNSSVQESYGAPGRDELEAAGAEVAQLPGSCIRVGDFGSSEGANSCKQLDCFVVSARRTQGGESKAIEVTHMDTPGNDWRELFRAVSSMPDSYRRHPDTFTYAFAGSFYEQCFPTGTLDLVYSSMAFHWGRRVKVKESVAAGSCGDVPLVADVAEEGAQDWLTILRLRTTELRPGGCLVVLHPGQSKGIAWLFSTLDRAWATLAAEGEITQEEKENLVFVIHVRSMQQLLAPIEGGEVELQVVSKRTVTVPCPITPQYRADGDKTPHVRRLVGFLSSFTTSGIEDVLNGRPTDERQRISSSIWDRVTADLMSQQITLGLDAEMHVLSLRKVL